MHRPSKPGDSRSYTSARSPEAKIGSGSLCERIHPPRLAFVGSSTNRVTETALIPFTLIVSITLILGEIGRRSASGFLHEPTKDTVTRDSLLRHLPMTPWTSLPEIHVKVLFLINRALKKILWTLILSASVLGSKFGHHSPPNEIPPSLHRRDDRALRHESLPQQIEAFVNLIELAKDLGRPPGDNWG